MAKKILTQQDLEDNPQLVADGFKEGDEIESKELSTPSEPQNEENIEDDPGSNNPPKKPNLP